MEELLTSGWGIFVTLAGGIAIIIGFVKGIENIKDWFTKKADEKVRHDHLEDRLMTAVSDLEKSIVKRDEDQSRRIDELFARLDKIDSTVKDMNEQSAALTYDKLMGAYSKYCVKQEPISVSALSSLQRIHEAYAKNGRNHIPTDFMERLRKCPIES